MRRRRIALVLACAGAVAIVPAGVAMSQADPEQPVLGPEQSQAVPALTGAQVSDAAAVVSRDQGLGQVTKEATGASAAAVRRVSRRAIARAISSRGRARSSTGGLTLQNIGVWSDAAGRAFGVELTVGLPAPTTITADWPTLADPSSGWMAPTVHYTARNVRALTIDVDLDQRRVVDVQPDAGAEIVAPDGTELPAPADGEGE